MNNNQIMDVFIHYKGAAYVTSGLATWEGRAEKATSLALSNRYSLKNYKDSKTLLMNFSGGADLGLSEINDAAQIIQDRCDPEIDIQFSAVLDESKHYWNIIK